MSDPDPMPDPIDAAYLEAEAGLSGDEESRAARAERRARVLAAVASQGAPARRAPLWRRGGWLVAAGVAGLALLMASQLYRPFPVPPPKPPAAPAAVTAKVAAPDMPSMAQAAAPRGRAAAAPRRAAARGEPAPPSPSPVTGAVASELAPPPAPPPAPPASATGGANPAGRVQELTVTAQKREQSLQSVPVAVSAFTAAQRDVVGREPPDERLQTGQGVVSAFTSAPDPGVRLRAAAAAGRTRDIEALLKHGVPVDAADADGDTALMKSIEAGRPAAAALLLRHGASLDATNAAGESARDIATAKGDPKLDKALGLEP